MIKPDSNGDNPRNFVETEEDIYEPVDPGDNSTDTDIDDYKDMLIEMHRFAKKHKSSYNWDNLK